MFYHIAITKGSNTTFTDLYFLLPPIPSIIMSHTHQPPQIQHPIHIIKREAICNGQLSICSCFWYHGTHNSGALLVMLFMYFFYLHNVVFLILSFSVVLFEDKLEIFFYHGTSLSCFTHPSIHLFCICLCCCFNGLDLSVYCGVFFPDLMSNFIMSFFTILPHPVAMVFVPMSTIGLAISWIISLLYNYAM
jgi:FtsH-binding integral membrane protein